MTALGRRERSPTVRPAFTPQDAVALAEIPLLAVTALLAPERRWHDVCLGIESLKALGAFREPRAAASIAAAALGTLPGAIGQREFAITYAAHRLEQFLQGLRQRLPGGWSATATLEGARHLAEALAAGRGAIVWVAPFAFAPLASKRALAEAGFAIAHVSRPGHGFTTSRFGVAVLNPLRVGAENRWLAERLVIEDGRAGATMIRAQRALRANRVVSITAGGWEGERIATVRLVGGETDLAVGAPGLARLAGAPLLPIVTVRGEVGNAIRVIVEPPVPVAAEGPRDAALIDAAQAYADRVDPWIRRHPDEWREWCTLRLPGGDVRPGHG